MERYMLGIDAGATKTAYALYSPQQDRTWLLYGGCGNHEGMPGGYDEFRTVMDMHIRKLCDAAGIAPQDVSCAGLGIAGVDTKRQHALISEIFRGIGLLRFRLANDAVLGIKAECPTGVCAVNGTGFCVYGIDDQGSTAQAGGLGHLTGDRGGGSYYAEQAIQAVYNSLEKHGPDTSMTARVLELVQAESPDLFVERLSECMEGPERERVKKELSVTVHACAQQGDPVALGILTGSGEEYAASIGSVLRRLPRLTAGGQADLVLVGSCFLRAGCTRTRDVMEARLCTAFPEIRFTIQPIRSEPVVGALLWAAEEETGDAIPEAHIRTALAHAIRVP